MKIPLAFHIALQLLWLNLQYHTSPTRSSQRGEDIFGFLGFRSQILDWNVLDVHFPYFATDVIENIQIEKVELEQQV